MTQNVGASSRQVFLDAAEELLARRGYAAMSIAAVCKAAGLPVGSLYWHFKNKADLAVGVLRHGTERFFEDLPTGTDVVGTPRERLERYYMTAAEVFERSPRFLRVELLLSLQEYDDLDVRSETARIHEALVDRIAGVIEPVAHEAGLADAPAVARELAGMTLDITAGAIVAHSLGSQDYATSLRRALDAVLAMIDRRAGLSCA
ncbi:TetR/AcrR family transcriptional regulator [Streptomyces griseiscabiei]|uniref:TetR/AcrR family transcriptional regulator n=1 Tax=Streptomyces griseiscabiei TaxID=2993540 RepID=A0ABU4LG44_9ACTN|nr:TetR/AcrR family transcriptional regulator [Streptomyces griseiscabiei]MBZ3900415.1 TetR/AcrR family transcriptional regulator [Streptomyces griseiscabiei]MDX2914583.1 TetR/AcrR family transcriptional regulator [Streptomyces griseiscabiei]